MITTQSSFEQLKQEARSHDARNIRNLKCGPAGPGWIKLQGTLEDDSSIPNQPRERMPRMCFENVVVRADASTDEMRDEIHKHARRC